MPTLNLPVAGGKLARSALLRRHLAQLGCSGHAATVIGTDMQAPAQFAALANGTMAHAFELDNLTWPNSGVHPGATMFVPALAVAQERSAFAPPYSVGQVSPA